MRNIRKNTVLEKDHKLGLAKIEPYLMDEFLFNFLIRFLMKEYK